MERKLGLVGAGVAVVGIGVLGGCGTPPTTPTTTIPSPLLGCYTTSGNSDLKIVGPQGTANSLEIYSEGSACANGLQGPISYVFGSSQAAALTACQVVDPSTVQAIDLTAWATPSPGLAGYWACSPK